MVASCLSPLDCLVWYNAKYNTNPEIVNAEDKTRCTVLHEHTLNTFVLLGACPTKSTDNATETTMIVPN